MDSTVGKFQIDSAAASLRRLVQDQLRRAILTRHFPPGTHLSDRILCETFRVSRAVVREAIRQMEAEDLVETIPHRGSFVKTLSVEDAEQIYEVRGVLEGLAAKGFARNATDLQIQQLSNVMAAIATLRLGTAAEKQLIDLKQEFYAILFDGCRNAYVQTMLKQILNRTTLLRATSLTDPKRLPRSIMELNRIVAAIRRRDEEGARAASVEHVRNAAQTAIEILTRLDKESEATDNSSEQSKKNGFDMPTARKRDGRRKVLGRSQYVRA